MPSIRSIAFALSLAAPLAAANAAEWRASVYEADGFSVDFSGSVEVEPLPVKQDTRSVLLRSTSYVQDSGDHGYNVTASLSASNANLNLSAAAEAVMSRLQCAKIESDAMSPAGQGMMREIHASDCLNGTFRFGGRFVVRGRWYYQVTYIVSSDDQLADARHFLTSFKLIPETN